MSETIKVMHLEGCTVRIHIPEITEEERRIKFEKFKKATAEFLREVEKVKYAAKDKTA